LHIYFQMMTTISCIFRPCLVARNFANFFNIFLSHRIFRRMYEALNIDKK
jgi:hypothetical protein